jgi:hypothetical protein
MVYFTLNDSVLDQAQFQWLYIILIFILDMLLC